MKEITLYRRDFKLLSDGSSFFDDVLCDLKIPAIDHEKVKVVEIKVDSFQTFKGE